MREVRFLASILILLLVASYLAWTREEKKPGEERVTIAAAAKEEVDGLRLVTETQTVAVSLQAGPDGKRFAWFKVESKQAKRNFVGNEKTDELIASFAPFQALRSLGTLNAKELKEVKLEHPRSKLEIDLKAGPRLFDVGGRSYGARDFYVRPQGGQEVFLVASRLLGDLEYPDSRFMLRRVRSVDLKDVTAVVIKAGPREKRALHKNRLSDKDAFWAGEKSPDKKSETFENYLHKVENLSILSFPDADAPALKDRKTVLEVVWMVDDQAREHLTLTRGKAPPPPQANAKPAADDGTKYFVESEVTHAPAEVARATAEELERDLSEIFAD